MSAEPKPSHLSRDYAAWFKDPRLAAAYPARPAYPNGLIDRLMALIADEPRVVLDVGCGTGELSRRLSPNVERVDAVDFSAAMLHLGKRLAGDSARNVNWILGAVEEVELGGPYALITAGESLHWMDWEVVMSRFASTISESGVLAIAGRSLDIDAAVRDRVIPIIERHSPVKDYRPYDTLDGLRQRGLFDVVGEQRFGPDPWRPTIDEYLECRHSQRGLSRTHMGEDAVAAFDAEIREAFADLCKTGVVAQHEGRLELTTSAHLTWGRPRPFTGV